MPARSVTGPVDSALVAAELEHLCRPDVSRRRASSAVQRITVSLATQLRPTAPPVLVPVLRAGAAMLPAASTVLDYPQVCWARAAKNKTARTVQVAWHSAGRINPDAAVILDVVLARGDTIVALVRHLRHHGYQGTVHVLACYAAPEGVDQVLTADQQVHLIIGQLADSVDAAGYVVPPTYGDIGSKLYGDIDQM